MNVISALLSNANLWENPCSRLISYAQRAGDRRQTLFSNLTYYTNYSVSQKK